MFRGNWRQFLSFSPIFSFSKIPTGTIFGAWFSSCVGHFYIPDPICGIHHLSNINHTIGHCQADPKAWSKNQVDIKCVQNQKMSPGLLEQFIADIINHLHWPGLAWPPVCSLWVTNVMSVWTWRSLQWKWAEKAWENVLYPMHLEHCFLWCLETNWLI